MDARRRIGNLSYVGAEGQMQRAADQWEMTNKHPDGTQHLSACVCTVGVCARAPLLVFVSQHSVVQPLSKHKATHLH